MYLATKSEKKRAGQDEHIKKKAKLLVITSKKANDNTLLLSLIQIIKQITTDYLG